MSPFITLDVTLNELKHLGEMPRLQELFRALEATWVGCTPVRHHTTRIGSMDLWVSDAGQLKMAFVHRCSYEENSPEMTVIEEAVKNLAIPSPWPPPAEKMVAVVPMTEDTVSDEHVEASYKVELRRLADENFKLRQALIVAHQCATLRDDGTCDGCAITEALQRTAS